MAAREREKRWVVVLHRCGAKDLWKDGRWEKGSSPVRKTQIARDSANLTSSTCFVKNCYQAIPKSLRLLASMPTGHIEVCH